MAVRERPRRRDLVGHGDLAACLVGDRHGAALLAAQVESPAEVLDVTATLAAEMLIFTVGQATPLAMLQVVVREADGVTS